MPEPLESPSRSAGTFPAGSAVAALGLSFLLARLVSRVSADYPQAARFAMVTGITGALLASVAMVRFVADDLRASRGLARVTAGLRALVALPVIALVAAAAIGPPAALLQLTGLTGAALLMLLSLGEAVVRARGLWLARGALGLLLLGELIELAWPPAHYALSSARGVPVLVTRLGALSELAAIVGSAFAAAWAVRSTLRTAGVLRTRLFLPLPVFLTLMLSMLATSIPQRVAAAVGEVAFGARFDLVWRPDRTGMIGTPSVLLYLLVPELILCAAAVSVAGVMLDRGAAARRTLGWLAILYAGFGAVRLAGPVDPIRIVTVCLGAMLLSRAAVLEVEEREAPVFDAASTST